MEQLINSIAHGYEGEEILTAIGDYDNMNVVQKSDLLEDYLTTVCNSLAEANKITGNLNVNMEYLLSIVASYLIGKQSGDIPEDALPPSILFEESLFPNLEEQFGIVVETIEEGEDIGYTEDTSDDEGINTN